MELPMSMDRFPNALRTDMGLPMSMEPFGVFFYTLTWDSPCQWIPSKQFSCSRPANCRLIRSSVGSAIWQRAPRNSPGKFICYDNVRANKLPLTLSSNSAPSAFRGSAAVRPHIDKIIIKIIFLIF